MQLKKNGCARAPKNYYAELKERPRPTERNRGTEPWCGRKPSREGERPCQGDRKDSGVVARVPRSRESAEKRALSLEKRKQLSGEVFLSATSQ